jgi:membrane glycosyltransferase
LDALSTVGSSAGRPPTVASLRRRRTLFATLVAATGVAVFAALTAVLGGDGLSALDLAMLAAFAVTLPWTVVGFWNAVVGFAILRLARSPVHHVAPLAALDGPSTPPRGRTAIVVPIYNEDPRMVVRHVEATMDDLAAAGPLDGFELFVLSDTQHPATIRAESAAIAALRARCAWPERFHYRRRRHNTGYKTGNLWDFVDRHGHRFDHMLVLDADSVMSGAAIHRLVRVMEANPRLGILQTLITALPTRSAFARLFQFGMRHGMRSYATGAAWWQGPHGPYWGHNALINLPAFRAHGRLPHLDGPPPWGGQLLSHDLVEAVQLQRAGYEVRVLPDEFGSHELNPPCLPEFVRRNLRWCQGNLQYLRLIGRPGWHPMGRLQLGLAILMYLSGPGWLVFMTLGFVQGAFGLDGGEIAANPWGAPPSELGILLLATMITMTFAPKLAGLADALVDGAARRSYGGPGALVGAGLIEFVHGMLLAPITAFSETFFIGRLLSGRGLAWRSQARDGRGVSWREAWRRFWGVMLAGTVVLVAFAQLAPGLLVWIVPVVTGPLLVVPFAWLTTRPWLGRALAGVRFAAVPEERVTPPIVARAVPWAARLARRRAAAAPALEVEVLARPAPAASPVAGGGD